jgi:diacylglycerol kinase (ATP)
VNGERFTVMTGTGFNPRMISDADRNTMDRLGRVAYVITGIRNLGRAPGEGDPGSGRHTFLQGQGLVSTRGKVSCVLAASVGKILGGIEAFPEARPDDGRLELELVTAGNTVQWARTFAGPLAARPPCPPRSRSGSGSARRSATSSTAARLRLARSCASR